MDRPDWTLGVLLGGARRRMGEDKALLECDQITLLEHCIESCAPQGGETMLAVGTRGRPLPPSLEHLPQVEDGSPGCGPLAGIEALARAARTPWLVVVPCDMPGLSRSALEALLEDVPTPLDYLRYHALGRDQVLPLALRPAWAAQFAGELLSQGKRRIADLLDQGRGRTCPWARSDDATWVFHNVNTQHDFQAWCRHRRRADGGPGGAPKPR